jgi:hypothetical protein
MNVYLVILEDRHTDVQVEVFVTKGAAVGRAKQIVEEYDYTPTEPDKPVEGWPFHATLSGEGDRVCVRMARVQKS